MPISFSKSDKRNNNRQKRVQKKGAARKADLQTTIQKVVDGIDRFDHTNKYQLAADMMEQFKQPIGKINHLIDRAMRKKLYNWLVDEIGERTVLHDDEYQFITQNCPYLFPGYLSPAGLKKYVSEILNRNKQKRSKTHE